MGWVGVQWGGVGACMCPVPSRPTTPLLPATRCLQLAATCCTAACYLLPATYCLLLAAGCCKPPAASCCFLLLLLMPAAAACAAACRRRRRRRPALFIYRSDFGIPISVRALRWPCDEARASRPPQTFAGRISMSATSPVLQDEMLESTSKARSVEFSPGPKSAGDYTPLLWSHHRGTNRRGRSPQMPKPSDNRPDLVGS